MKNIMDMSPVKGIPGVFELTSVGGTRPLTRTGAFSEEENRVDGTLFDSFLNAAIDNIKTTNTYFSEAEDEKIKFALGETDNPQELSVALQKASAALQYTVAVRDKLLEAYKELMQMQV